MLDGVSDMEGSITIVPGKPTPPPPAAQQVGPVGGAPPPAQPASPAANKQPNDLAELFASVISQGIYVSPPPRGSPASAALEQVALKCQANPMEAAKGLSVIGRNVVTTGKLQPATDQKASAKVLDVVIAPPTTPLPAAFKCLVGDPPPELRMELLAGGRDLGPIDVLAVPHSAISALEQTLSFTYGMKDNAWRLATAVELLALMPAFFDENLWGPDGAEYWTGTTLANGEHVIVKAQTKGRNFEAFLETRDANAKARPIWVRAGTP